MLQSDSPTSFPRTHAAPDLFFGGHFKVAAKLLVQLSIDPFLSEKRTKAACSFSNKGHSPTLQNDSKTLAIAATCRIHSLVSLLNHLTSGFFLPTGIQVEHTRLILIVKRRAQVVPSLLDAVN
jgi:hypothetical protein